MVFILLFLTTVSVAHDRYGGEVFVFALGAEQVSLLPQPFQSCSDL